MPHTPPVPLPPADDTPVDERAPYADPRRIWPLVVGVILAVLVALVVAAVAVRRVWRALRSRPRHEVIMFPDYSTQHRGPTYRCEFYDGSFRQLLDMDLRIVLPDLYGQRADSDLDYLARCCVAEVESRDGARCFKPRLVVFDGDEKVRVWAVRL